MKFRLPLNTRHFFKFSLLILILPLLISACDSSAERKEIALAAWQMIDDGALVIDVRSPKEYAGGHLEIAANIPHTDTAALIKAIGENKSRPVVLYCRSGQRSGVAQQALAKAGYYNIFNGLGFKRLQAIRR
ncbi:MAG: rhodanese-like domain-containing protein [Xanthomonadales bacterium]|nr:rhodanese-like domain-containing protein [Xanthomonadales bacterium]